MRRVNPDSINVLNQTFFRLIGFAKKHLINPQDLLELCKEKNIQIKRVDDRWYIPRDAAPQLIEAIERRNFYQMSEAERNAYKNFFSQPPLTRLI